MLSLKQSLSLNSIRPLGVWQPSSEGTKLIAWYKNKTGITLNGSDVSQWDDSSDNSYNMAQTFPSNQPEYIASTGALRFVPENVQSLQTGSDIELSGNFTIGIKLYPNASNIVVLGDNTMNNEFFKITSTTNLRFKTDGSTADLAIESGSFVGDNYLVITRNASDLVTLYFNGVAQSDTETLAGTANIDAIGVRNLELNPYSGDISEIQIYDTETTALTANVNDYLAGL